jgi:hypothetical protein
LTSNADRDAIRSHRSGSRRRSNGGQITREFPIDAGS